MPWGKSVSDREFLHFVVPVRVNNENLDECRMEFYAELKDRVKNLSNSRSIIMPSSTPPVSSIPMPKDSRLSSLVLAISWLGLTLAMPMALPSALLPNVFRNQTEADLFRLSDFPELPANVIFGVDSEGYTIGIGETLLKSIRLL